MANQEKIEEILNKKFKQSVFSGYDTYDVDEFFDNVIEYLKEDDRRVKEAEIIANKLKLDNDRLSIEVQNLIKQNSELKIKIEEFCANGYKNVVNNTRTQKTQSIKEGK